MTAKTDREKSTREGVVLDLRGAAALYEEAASAVTAGEMNRAARLMLAAACKSDAAAHLSKLLASDALLAALAESEKGDG